MPEVFSPVAIEQKIADVSNRIATGVNLADEKYRAFLDADRAYDAAFAKAYMAYSGPAHAKKYAAELDTTDERAARDVADAAYRYTDRRTRAYQDELRSLQSIGASVRQAYSVAGRNET
ncbi:hypothetical protein CH305_18335 [Rhodococcus sp. 15-649-2-2]|uniref:hypothetical protein n=1 Tax=Rhodococcus sp. 15-649-2-2 TaxID=2023140 RepID=UPI000B9A3A49|nr:hypothetical protein [Rhodococcus sp. 15-649-2-2]OZE77196.1 hypothetical protein CH305_18335 [Rhodococcus sp. 15-649-2-2]